MFWFVGAILLIIMAIYLAVPSYTFADIEPFKGDFIYNPYSKIDRINYIDFRSESIENQGINVYEYGYALTGTRFLCLGYTEKRKIDYPFLQSVHYKQFNIDQLNKKCRLVAPAHPSKGFKKVEMTRLDHYRVMEALSPNDNSLYYWDIALSNGHRVNIIANTGDEFGADSIKYLTACIGDNDAKSILNSLETGNSYAVKYSGSLIEVSELQKVTLRNDTLFVSVSEKAKGIRFIGQNAIVKQRVSDVTEACYHFEKNDTYIRTEIEFENGNILYLNPLVRHQYQYFFDLDKAKIMKGRTYLMWAVYILVVIAFARLIFTRKKHGNSGK
ncbi:MAG: hypothetical protein IKS65_04020 [Bacteroidales bacterium]|nr:hypothetical protein [Bacteroidales bacterium]